MGVGALRGTDAHRNDGPVHAGCCVPPTRQIGEYRRLAKSGRSMRGCQHQAPIDSPMNSADSGLRNSVNHQYGQRNPPRERSNGAGTARLYRRRFHRRHRSRQHAGARRHAHGADHRRARSNAAIEADALVVALKSRTIPAAEAVAQSLAALDWLRAQGCRQFFFKYCSTFDSTDAGNIGPVADALLDALSAERADFDDCLPGVSRERPDDLSRQPVRRRRVAERIGHGESSAHADARPESRAGAAAADQVESRPHSI